MGGPFGNDQNLMDASAGTMHVIRLEGSSEIAWQSAGANDMLSIFILIEEEGVIHS